MKKVKKWISHNQGQFISLLICAGVLIYVFGCESKVKSLLKVDKMVTAEELEVEFETEAARLELEIDNLSRLADVRFGELARQDAIKQKLMDAALITTQSGGINVAGVVGLLFSVFGIGATIDNRIKDKVIRNRPLVKKEA